MLEEHFSSQRVYMHKPTTDSYTNPNIEMLSPHFDAHSSRLSSSFLAHRTGQPHVVALVAFVLAGRCLTAATASRRRAEKAFLRATLACERAERGETSGNFEHGDLVRR